MYALAFFILTLILESSRPTEDTYQPVKDFAVGQVGVFDIPIPSRRFGIELWSNKMRMCGEYCSTPSFGRC